MAKRTKCTWLCVLSSSWGTSHERWQAKFSWNIFNRGKTFFCYLPKHIILEALRCSTKKHIFIFSPLFWPLRNIIFTHPVSNTRLHRPNFPDPASQTLFLEHVSGPCFVLIVWSSYTLFPRTSFSELVSQTLFLWNFCNPFSQTLFFRPFCTSWATILVLHILTCPDRSCGRPLNGDLLTLSSSLNLTMSGGSKRSMGLALVASMALDGLPLLHGHQQRHRIRQDGHQLQHTGQHGPATLHGQHILHITPREGHITTREGHITPPEGRIRDQSLIVTTISSRKCFIGWVTPLDSELLYHNVSSEGHIQEPTRYVRAKAFFT